MNRLLLGLSLIGLLAGCSSTGSSPDGGDADGGGVTCPEGNDNNNDTDSAVALDAGDSATGVICPRGDRDFYRVTLPNNAKILHLSLQQSTTISSVALTYQILNANGTAVYSNLTPNTQFSVAHCLDAGTYFVVVEDSGNDSQDPNSAYSFSYTTENDSDENEVNDAVASATAVSGTMTGAISCVGDRDFFEISVGTDELLEVTLTTEEASDLELAYTITDANGTIFGAEEHTGGSRVVIDLQELHALPAAGTYYLIVEDKEGDDGDPTIDYSLAVQTVAEADVNDQGTRNDEPDDATVLGSYTAGTHTAPWTANATGQIGSKADVDYYRINGITFDGYADALTGIIEVTVDFGGAATLQPQVALIFGDEDSACTDDGCCRVLEGGSCFDGLDDACLRKSYSCSTKGDTYCVDCETSPGPTCSTERACTGLGKCLPSDTCGVAMATVSDPNGTDTAIVVTAQPLIHPGPWYIRVTDFGGTDYDHGNDYTISVKVAADPDRYDASTAGPYSELILNESGGTAIEWDNEYIPPQIAINSTNSAQIGDLHEAQQKQSRLPNVTVNGSNEITEIVVEGYLTFDRDRDRFWYPHPCPQNFPTPGYCTANAELTKSGSCPSDLDFVFNIGKGGDLAQPVVQIGLTGAQSSFTFGPANHCFVYGPSDRTGTVPFTNQWITVAEQGGEAYGWECKYSLRIYNIQSTCAAPCDEEELPVGSSLTPLPCINPP